MEFKAAPPWNLAAFCLAAVTTSVSDDDSDDESSIASDRSQITTETESLYNGTTNVAVANNLERVIVTPSSLTVPVRTIDLTLFEMPPEERRKV
jgi:hypothetical protein